MFKKSQMGRSMIEMLGVLAIIGVLSVGGLAGYTRAMRSNRVNNIVDYTNRCWVAVRSQGRGSGTIVHADCSTFITDDVPSGATSIQCGRGGIDTYCYVYLNSDELKNDFAAKVNTYAGSPFVYDGSSWTSYI